MPISKAEFIDGFADETQEHLDVINNEILLAKKEPQNRSHLSLVLRELHTLKGTARMMGCTSIENLAHSLEDVYKGIVEEKFELTERIIQLTFTTGDCIKHCLQKLKDTGSDAEIDISKFTSIFKKAASGFFFSVEELEKENTTGNIKTLEDMENEENTLENITSIRIDLDKINDILRSFDNLIVHQFRFKHQLEEFERRMNKNDYSEELPKQLKEDMLLTENAIFDTQHKLLNLRMLPLKMILSPLKKEIISECFRMGKQIDFNIPETDFMLDKTILEKLREILLHLVRNSFDHGIEPPDERKALGKDPQGKISIISIQVSNHINIMVRDDGRGIQFEKIRQKALKLYPKKEKEISEMNDKELQQFIFVSGFSTNDTINPISGRGIGLDIVRSSMEKIKGKIHIDTKLNEGTTFTLTIPVSLATQQGLFVHSGNMKFMIPSNYISEIITTSSDSFVIMQGQPFVSLHGTLIPVYYLSSIIGSENKTTTNSLIVVEYLETKIGIAVDTIDQYENVVVNPLPLILRSINALQGVVYDENYSIIPILHIPDIIRRMKSLLSYDLKKYQIKNKEKNYTVLIVDDSVTTRQIEQTIFETAGYKVEIAGDGIEGLDILKNKQIDAIITDIKMPRMDGLVFLNNVRRMEESKDTPVIVVSGVYDPEVKRSFMQNGAQAFIVKSNFQRGNLLQAAKELLGE